MKMINNFLMLIIIFFLPFSAYSQKIKLKLTNETPRYENIISVLVGPEVSLSDPISEYEVGYRYRMIQTRAEIYETLYFEKLILNVEGGVHKIEWTFKLSSSSLIDKLGISPEHIIFHDAIWMEASIFYIHLDNRILSFDMNSYAFPYIEIEY